MIDESPDTSHLGEYSNRPANDFAIDRAHAEDCASVQVREFEASGEWGYWNGAAETILDRIESAIQRVNPESDYYTEEEEQAIETLRELANSFECDCGERGDMGRNELRYFNPYAERYKGESPEDIRKYVRQDYDRMESLNAGNWCYVGICAEATIMLAPREDGGLTQTIRSGGLWGIESDSDRSYFQEVQQEELANLKAELLALGFSKRAIATAFKDVKEVQS
jgi:hypothetical protein